MKFLNLAALNCKSLAFPSALSAAKDP
jgi:hypothetical protein